MQLILINYVVGRLGCCIPGLHPCLYSCWVCFTILRLKNPPSLCLKAYNVWTHNGTSAQDASVSAQIQVEVVDGVVAVIVAACWKTYSDLCQHPLPDDAMLVILAYPCCLPSVQKERRRQRLRRGRPPLTTLAPTCTPSSPRPTIRLPTCGKALANAVVKRLLHP